MPSARLYRNYHQGESQSECGPEVLVGALTARTTKSSNEGRTRRREGGDGVRPRRKRMKMTMGMSSRRPGS